jgi:hypothetical protein
LPFSLASISSVLPLIWHCLRSGNSSFTLSEAQIIIESPRRHHNTIMPHAPLGYKPPASEVFVPPICAWPASPYRPAPATHAGATANSKLTFNLDHPMGADRFQGLATSRSAVSGAFMA